MRQALSDNAPNRKHSLLLGFGIFVGFAFAIRQGTAQMSESFPMASNQVVHVAVSRPNTPKSISPNLFGSFLEPIGYSIYGGLWADVVVNPSFEEGLWSAENYENELQTRPELRDASRLGLPMPWQPLYPSQGARYSPVRGDAANSSQSVLVMSLPNQEVGIFEQVYLPTARELIYHGTIWIKHLSGNDGVWVSLRRHGKAEEVLSSFQLKASNPGWSKYAFQFTLTAEASKPLEPVDLAISLRDGARALVDNVSLVPADAVEGMDPDVLTLARELKTPLVRFGGNYTSAYDWRDGIGDANQRISKLNVAWGIPEYNTFGTEEFLEFCRLVHAKPQIALNLGTGTPEEAAAWVKYVSMHWNQPDGEMFWELGNELWGDYQVGYPAQLQIAGLTQEVSQAVRKVDPHSKLIATGGDAGKFSDWNAQLLRTPANTFDYISSHFIVDNAIQLPHPSDQFHTMAILATPWGLSRRIDEIKEQAVQANRRDIHLAFTEWLLIPNSATLPNYNNVGGAIFAAGFLNALMRKSDIVTIADMTGILEFGGIWKKRGQVYVSPAYWVLRTYANAEPSELLDVNSDASTYSIAQGVSQMPEVKDVPYLDIVAAESKDQSKLLLFCVNRHLSVPIRAEIDLHPLGIKVTEATITTIQADNILASNDETTPNHVSPSVAKRQISSLVSYTFPSASITVLEIPFRKF